MRVLVDEWVGVEGVCLGGAVRGACLVLCVLSAFGLWGVGRGVVCLQRGQSIGGKGRDVV